MQTARPTPFFPASLLTSYQQRHGLDDVALAAVLGCSLDVLTDLRLCRPHVAAEPRWTVEEGVAIRGQCGGNCKTA